MPFEVRALAGQLANLTVGPRLPAVTGGTAVVTGASSGIGRAVATDLVARGFAVIGTSRHPDTVTAPPAGVRFLPLDLADGASIDQFVSLVHSVQADKAGSPLVVVNNAGESQFGALEDIPDADIARLFHINVVGQLSLTRQLLPGMRARGRGRIVMVGSMLGTFPLAYRSTYVGAKAALRGAATALRGEVAPLGIGVSTVEPGSIATGISQRRTVHIPTESVYSQPAHTVLTGLNTNETRGVPAEAVSATIMSAISADRPRAYYAVGSGAPLTTFARRLLPEQSVAVAVARRHGLR